MIEVVMGHAAVLRHTTDADATKMGLNGRFGTTETAHAGCIRRFGGAETAHAGYIRRFGTTETAQNTLNQHY